MTDQHLIPLEELNLSVRAYKCLKSVQVNLVSDLVDFSYEDLLEIKNFGSKSANEVIEALERIGMTLRRGRITSTSYRQLLFSATQAVRNAVNHHETNHSLSANQVAAVAFRALATPHCDGPSPICPLYSTTYARHELLAIADELEGQ